MSPKHTQFATWIGAIAAVVALIPFVTGKAKLADFFQSRIAAPLPNTITLPLLPTDRITLHELLALRMSCETTLLQKAVRESQLQGQRVNLTAYIRSASRQLGNVIVQVSEQKDCTIDFTVWPAVSTANAWGTLNRGAHVEFQGILKKPLIGELVAEQAQLIRVLPQ